MVTKHIFAIAGRWKEGGKPTARQALKLCPTEKMGESTYCNAMVFSYDVMKRCKKRNQIVAERVSVYEAERAIR